MCGRYALKTSTPNLAAMLGVDIDSVPDAGSAYEGSCNIPPSQSVLTCYSDKNGERRLARMRWGLIPGWSKDGAAKFAMINARAETIDEKPAYRTAFRRRRCLIPADAFYEWRKRGNHKQPYCIRMRDESPFAFAGVWERWKPEDGEPVYSCSIITTLANDTLTPIHPRMPVILSPKDYGSWVDQPKPERDSLLALLKPHAPEPMVAFPVSTFVNKPENDDERCWQALADE